MSEYLKWLDEEMIAAGRLLSRLAERGVDGATFQAVVERHDCLETTYVTLGGYGRRNDGQLSA